MTSPYIHEMYERSLKHLVWIIRQTEWWKIYSIITIKWINEDTIWNPRLVQKVNFFKKELLTQPLFHPHASSPELIFCDRRYQRYGSHGNHPYHYRPLHQMEGTLLKSQTIILTKVNLYLNTNYMHLYAYLNEKEAQNKCIFTWHVIK